MSVADRCFPELRSNEVNEIVAPFADLMCEVRELVGAAPRRAAVPGVGAVPVAVSRWVTASELYPFQRILRNLAVSCSAVQPTDVVAAAFDNWDSIRLDLLQHVENRLCDLWIRPLVVAINRARTAGRLEGADAGSRYEFFSEAVLRAAPDLELRIEEMGAITFPVARALTAGVMTQTAVVMDELAERLLADRPDIETAFGIDTRDVVTGVRFAAGDTHHHGRSVAVLQFRSGRRVVYKPRDVSCEAAWEVLVRRANLAFMTSLTSAAVVRRNGWGWVDHVESEPITEPAAFMRTSGELAAVMYLLDARDMHFENIIPTVRGPVPIDLETILHPARVDREASPGGAANAHDILERSIYGIGLLPLIMLGRGTGSDHMDLGFLGGPGRGRTPFKNLQFIDPFTDRVRLELSATSAPDRHTVLGALTESAVRAAGQAMADGFSAVLRAVMADREAWQKLLRETVSDVTVRYVHNPTMLYGQILRVTAGAEPLHDGEVFATLLSRVALASKASAQVLVESEVRQLAVRDVPYFTVASSGTALQDGAGKVVGVCFPESPLERTLAKASELSDAALTEELKLLRSAFTAQFPDNHLPSPRQIASPALVPLSGRSDRGSVVDLAARLADALVATSRSDHSEEFPRTWIGPLASSVADRPWPPGVLGYDLYTGRYGPALALAAANRVLEHHGADELTEQIFTRTAEMLSGWHDEPDSFRQAGFAAYSGTAGILFALSAAGRILERPEWSAVAQEALPLVLEQVRGQSSNVPATTGLPPIDLIYGYSGVLTSLLAVGGPHMSTAVAELVPRLVDGLRDAEPLTQSGFAHGVAGIMHALARALPHVPEDGRGMVTDTLTSLAERLAEFFDEREQSWFTNVATPTSFATGWCHGAAGIALGLTACAVALPTATDVHAARDAAVSATRRNGFGRNLTWCHGDLGNHDVLRHIARTAPSPVRHDIEHDVSLIECHWLDPEGLAGKLADPHSRYSHTSSLMVGTSGVLLHLAHRLDGGFRVSPVTLDVELS